MADEALGVVDPRVGAPGEDRAQGGALLDVALGLCAPNRWQRRRLARTLLLTPTQIVNAAASGLTVGEIRARCDRLHAFTSTAEVEEILEKLGDKFPPMVVQLPKAPGTKEARFAHLLAGEGAVAALGHTTEAGDAPSPRSGRVAELEDEVRRLRQQVDWLTAEFEAFRKQFQ